MDILINARFLTQKLTGVQRFAVEIAKQIKQIMPSVVFVTPANIIHKELFIELGAKIIGSNKGVLWEQVDLPLFLIKSGKPLLINLCNLAPLFYSNQVITLHDVAFFVNPAWFSKKFVSYYKFLIPQISKKAKLIFTVSHFSKSEIIKYINVDPEKIKVIYNSVSDLPEVSKHEIDYGRYVLIVGSIDKRKNITNLIAAFNLILQKDFKLIIVGDVNAIFNNTGNENFKKQDDIVFLGRVNDTELAGLYSNALMFVYPSLYEGFGIPPLEAMAYGCPTIVSDIDSLKEICGDASLYVDPYNIEDISKSINLLAQDRALRNNLISRGRQNINRFSWKDSAKQIIDSIAF
ncbi:Glycosyltransferase involved in cell wall bisynthesis [Mucilaginibacter lappiensis]|uniref:Glycosyltransferase involved in cell wall biosynthesis n=1 Tax=Mucilaginibacter lappiensis TaxID=354630 RepID=A0ABR6PRL9_9SPHI|nr:glycosyltransferase family 1 protein [Mucilaginibacter lappiensis]MBB6112432.1 glycosyltransferase involved in cell wall biosynthesis [Mucilaginibacter lappiensis]SIS00498.1 Glycosyltransferase involved in cell wall bisynthesis [Mucilaginibacter lappiensis]